MQPHEPPDTEATFVADTRSHIGMGQAPVSALLVGIPVCIELIITKNRFTRNL